ncbi:hypothetical protein [Serratia marcescens]|uniref:hypothetical protein n=1 Tax=Serratia marcescens TaxID=615 RepID=UPI001F1504A1|nr:hypothetical protein [Serratia marcescens]MDP8728365.1 hypothetical protein [Serratia marcescens]
MKKLVILMIVAASFMTAALVILFGSKTYTCEISKVGKNHWTIGQYEYHAKVEDFGYKFKIHTEDKEYDSGLLSEENFSGVPVKFSTNKASLAFAKNPKTGNYQLFELHHGDNIVNLTNCKRI